MFEAMILQIAALREGGKLDLARLGGYQDLSLSQHDDDEVEQEQIHVQSRGMGAVWETGGVGGGTGGKARGGALQGHPRMLLENGWGSLSSIEIQILKY